MAEVDGRDVSVVVSTLDRPQLLARCLDALLDGSVLPAEIVVVDQGEPAGVAAVLEERRARGVPLVHVVQDVRGLSVSQNAGVARARRPVVSVVDDDCVPDRRWVEAAVQAHRRASGPVVVGGRVLPLPPQGDRVVELSTRGSAERRVLPDWALPWEVGTGGNFSVTRAAYLQVGGNDERLGTGGPGRGGNDLDLFHRLRRAGVSAVFEPDMLVHHERATVAELRSRSWTYGFGIGACTGLWLCAGDLSGLRLLVHWVRLRLRLLRAGHPDNGLLLEVRVLLGTLHGLSYGLRAGSASRRGGSAVGWRVLRALGHPARTAARLDRAVALPVTSRGRERRLLRTLTSELAGPVLVLGAGPAASDLAAVGATVAVAGTDPFDPYVEVVSEARGPGSVPHERWDAVVVAGAADLDDRLAAATAACRPGGAVLVRAPVGTAEVQRWLRTGDVHLVDAAPAVRPRWLLARKT
jgi:glycosyltransferase involved in cell wall biosynthesis